MNVQSCAPHVHSREKIFGAIGRVPLKTNGKLQQLLPWGDHYIFFRWLYVLFLGIDANFCLKRKNVSNDAADPDLNQGCAYLVEEKEYKKYLSEYKAETEPVCFISGMKHCLTDTLENNMLSP